MWLYATFRWAENRPRMLFRQGWCSVWGFPCGSVVKNMPAMQETWVWSQGWEHPLQKKMATHWSIVVWEIPWTEKSGGLRSQGLKESDINIATEHAHTCAMLYWKYHTVFWGERIPRENSKPLSKSVDDKK